ncbi:MAG: sodium:calcium antiporter, partial [Clostridia bacterium]|nr:sodium:calcium antiporter [Clostridia bacterium]
SINSATKGFSDMSLGNVIGSNIANFLLILGISASLRRLKLKKETSRLS